MSAGSCYAPSGDPAAPACARVSAARVFIGFTSQDERYAAALTSHLMPHLGQGRIVLLNATPLAGDDAATLSRAQLDQAEVIVLLVSPDFLADPQTEPLRHRALQRRLAGARVVTVQVRPSMLHADPLSDLEALPQAHGAISTSPCADAAWVEVANGISRILPVGTVEDAPRAWVLVAGSCVEGLSGELAEACLLLGCELAKGRYGLISAGWEGVDAAVVTAFAQTLDELRLPRRSFLKLVLSEDRAPLIDDAQVISVRGREPLLSEARDVARRITNAPLQSMRLARSSREWLEPVVRADVVVLLEGGAGTLETAEFARQLHRPVLPIAASYGSARQVYLDMVRSWSGAGMGGLCPRDFQRLLDGSMLETVRAAVSLLPRVTE